MESRSNGSIRPTILRFLTNSASTSDSSMILRQENADLIGLIVGDNFQYLFERLLWINVIILASCQRL